MMSDCRKCGLCCHLIVDGKISRKICKFLLPIGNNRFVCRIFKVENRVGCNIGEGNFCNDRRLVYKNYVNCNYNRPEWGKELNVGDEIENKDV